VAHLLRAAGFTSTDPLLPRLVALATQRFATGIAHDALQVERRRALKGGRRGGGKKAVLAVEDLAEALQEHGIALTRPPYLASVAGGGGSAGAGAAAAPRRRR
jgi:hypothetical protein